MDLKPKITFPTLGIFAALTLILFFVGRPMMTFHYDHDAVFLFSTRFAADMLSAPGGLSLYAGKFINQFMAMPLLAAILLALIMTDMFPFLMRIGSGKQNAPAMIFTVLTASAFILRQIPTAAVIALLLTLLCLYLQNRRESGILSWIAIPLLIWTAGSWMLIYVAMVMILQIRKKQFNPLKFSLLLAYSAVLVFIFYRFIWLVPISDYLGGLLPSSPFWTVLLLSVLAVAIADIRIPDPLEKSAPVISAVVMIACAVLFLQTDFATNEKNRQLVKNGNYPRLIEKYENTPVLSVAETVSLNYALAKENELLERMFEFPQSYGLNGLLPEPVKDRTNRILDNYWLLTEFYYEIGYVDHAYRMAYDQLVMEGITPCYVDMMIRCLLAEGHVRTADKYISMMEKMLFEGKNARHYRSLMQDADQYRQAFSDVRAKNPDQKKVIEYTTTTHLTTVLQKGVYNKLAFDYLCAAELLQKNPGFIANNIQLVNYYSKGKYPRLIQEALMVRQMSHSDIKLAVDKKKIRQDVAFKVISFAKTISSDPQPVREEYEKDYGGSFMVYSYFTRRNGVDA